MKLIDQLPPPNGERIWAIGDSWTAGAGVCKGEEWPNQLSKILNEPVYNMGIVGQSLEAVCDTLKEAIKEYEKPDVICLLDCKLSNSTYRIIKGKVFHITRLFIDRLIRSGNKTLLGYDYSWYKEQIENNIKTYNERKNNLIEWANSNDIVLIVRNKEGLVDRSWDRIHGGPLTHIVYAEWFARDMVRRSCEKV